MSVGSTKAGAGRLLWRRRGMASLYTLAAARYGSRHVGCVRHVCVAGRGPATEEVERLCGLGSGVGDVGHDCQPGIGGQLYAVVGEGDVADDGVVEVLGTGVVEADVVGAQRVRNSSLCVESSPTRFERSRS
jgi:hypothetical protein